MFEGAFGDRFTGFFGANLYIQAFDTEGQELRLMKGGKELVLHVTLSEGEVPRPALSARVEELRQKQELALLKQEEDERKMVALRISQIEREDQERRIARREIEIVQARKDAQFSKLNAHFAGHFIDECNETIAKVWSELDPRYPHEKMKGERRPKPFIIVRDGVFILKRSEDAQTGNKIGSPLSKLVYGRMEHHWKFLEWLVAVREGLHK